MASKYSVLLRTIVKENGLEPLHTSSDYDTRLLTVAAPRFSLPDFIITLTPTDSR